MITSKDAKLEVENAKKIVKTDEGRALLKVLEILMKLIGTVRRNTCKIMEFLKIPLDQPKEKNENKE